MQTPQQQTINEYMIFLQDIERIHAVTEYEQLIEAIDLKKLKDLFPKKMAVIEKILSKFKIGITSLKSMAKQEGQNLKKEFESGKSPEDISKIITSKASQAISQTITKSKDKIYQMDMGEKIAISVLAFLIIVYINTMVLSALLASGVAGPLAMQIVSIVVAPMVEEAAKTYFIDEDMPWTGTAVVFGLEFIQYAISLIFSGGAVISRVVIARLSSLLLHFTTTLVQKKIIEKGEEKGEDAAFKAWLIGVAIHSMWNIFSSVYNKQIAGWVFNK